MRLSSSLAASSIRRYFVNRIAERSGNFANYSGALPPHFRTSRSRRRSKWRGPHATKQVERAHAPRRWANTGVSRQTSSTGTVKPLKTPSAAPEIQYMEGSSSLSESASSCNGGLRNECQKPATPPGLDAVIPGKIWESRHFSRQRAEDTLTYNTYLHCTDTKTFLGRDTEGGPRWVCSSLHAGGKLTQEKVAAFKPRVNERSRPR